MNKNPDGNISAFNYNISPNPSVPDLKETKDINTSFLQVIMVDVINYHFISILLNSFHILKLFDPQDEIGAMPPAYDSLCSDNMQV